LHRSGTAENDLDLLFARTDAQRVTMLLAALGYREARPAASDEHTGIRDFFRWDAGADRFIHVHAHFRLVVGHDRTKNIQLPVERPFLASCT
jgi:hypothetical protein